MRTVVTLMIRTDKKNCFDRSTFDSLVNMFWCLYEHLQDQDVTPTAQPRSQALSMSKGNKGVGGGGGGGSLVDFITCT